MSIQQMFFGRNRGVPVAQAYVSNSADSTVTIINTATDTVVATVAMPFAPGKVAINPAQRKAYVATSGGLHYIHTKTHEVIATDLPSTGTFLVHNHDYSKLLMSDSSGNLTVIDTTTDDVIATIAGFGSGGPHGGVVDHTGHYAYLTNLVTDTVFKVDLYTNAIVATKSGLSNLRSPIAINADDSRIYFFDANAGVQSIAYLTPAMGTITYQYAPPGGKTLDTNTDIVIAPDGTVYSAVTTGLWIRGATSTFIEQGGSIGGIRLGPKGDTIHYTVVMASGVERAYEIPVGSTTTPSSYIEVGNGFGDLDVNNLTFSGGIVAPTPTPSPTASVTPTPSPSVGSSPTPTPSVTPTISVTPSVTATPTISVTPSTSTPAPSASNTPTPTVSDSPTPTPTSSNTPTPSPTPTPSSSAVVPGTEYMYYTISPNSGDTTNGYVGVLDIASNTIVTTITVGKGPRQILVDDVSMRAYVVNTVDNTISVINLYTNAVVHTINDLGDDLISSNLVLNSDNSYVYLLLNVNTAGVKYLGRISTSDYSWGINSQIHYGSTANGNIILLGDRVFGTRTQSDDVGEYLITGANTGTFTRSFALGSDPVTITSNSTKGKLYVGMANGTVKVLSTSSNTVTNTITVNATYYGGAPCIVSPDDDHFYTSGTVSSGQPNFFVVNATTEAVEYSLTVDRIPAVCVNPTDSKVYMIGSQSASGVRMWEYVTGGSTTSMLKNVDSSNVAYGRGIDYLQMGLAPSPTPTPTNTPTPTPTISTTPSPTPTPSETPPPPSPSNTPTPSPSVTPSPSAPTSTWTSLGTAGSGFLSVNSGLGFRMNVANAVAAGEVLVIALGRDNNTSGADSEATAYITGATDTKGNTYTLVKAWSNNQTGGATGAAVGLLVCNVTTALTTSDTITGNLTTARATTIGAITAWRFAPPAGKTASAITSYTLSADGSNPGSLAATGMATSPQHLVFRAIASETKTTGWTGTVGWTSIDRAATTQATDANNMSAGGEFILTNSTSVTSDPTLGSFDHASAMAVFEAV